MLSLDPISRKSLDLLVFRVHFTDFSVIVTLQKAQNEYEKQPPFLQAG